MILDKPPQTPQLLEAGNGGKPPIEIPVSYAAGDPEFYHIAVKLGDVATTGNAIIKSHGN